MQTESATAMNPKASLAPVRRGEGGRDRSFDSHAIGKSNDQAFDVLLAALTQQQTGFNGIESLKTGEAMFESPHGQEAANHGEVYDENSSASDLRQEARIDRTYHKSEQAGPITRKSLDRAPSPSHVIARSPASQSRELASRLLPDADSGHQSHQLGKDGSASSIKGNGSSARLLKELSRPVQSPLASPAAVTKSAVLSAPTNANAAHQVAKILATGQSQPASSIRPTVGSVSSSVAQDALSTGKAKGEATGRAANYEEVARSLNTHRPGATAFEQLVQSIRMRSLAGRSSANLQLHPPELGRIIVNVEMDGNDMRIDVHTESSQAKHLLSERVTHLQDALRDVGIQVDQITIDADVEPSQDQQVGSQDAQLQDEKTTTADRGSSFSRRERARSHTSSSSVVDTTFDVNRVEAITGIIDVKI